MPSSVSLGFQLEAYVTELVKSGRYHSRSEVLREGVRLVEEREKRLQALDAAIERGIADADAGNLRSLDAVASRLRQKYRDMEDTGA